MSIIEELYRGNNRSEESIIPVSDAYKAALQRANGYSEMLEQQLTWEQRKLLSDLLSARADMNDLEYLEFYREGLSLGIRLMLEVLTPNQKQGK